VYFGYQTIWVFTFVPIAFVLVMAVGIALAFVYAVGASRGYEAAARYTQVCGFVLLGGFVADLLYAAATGQWSAFVAAFGWTPLIEMGLLAAMFLGAMWLMAASYLGDKKP